MRKIATVILIFIGIQFLNIGKIYSQQDPLYSHYLFNRFLVNPAYAGARDALSLSAIMRSQLVGLDNGAPQTISFSAHSPLPPYGKMAVGVSFYDDQVGPMNDMAITAAFAYRFDLGPFNGKLSLGLEIGATKTGINYDLLDPQDPQDPFYQDRPKSGFKPDANFGVYYQSDHYFIGVSAKRLFANKYVVADFNGESIFSNLNRHFYIMAGGIIPAGEYFKIRPSVLVRLTDQLDWDLDANVSVLIYDLVWLGASYRLSNAISIFLEVNVYKGLRVGYAYDLSLGAYKAFSAGTHEIMIGYDLDFFQARVNRPDPTGMRHKNTRFF